MFCRFFILLSALFCLCSAATAVGSLPPGAWARYDMLSSVESKAVSLVEVTLIAGPKEKIGNNTLQWWEVDGKKADGEYFAIRLLSNSITMTGKSNAPGLVKRYLLKEGDAQPIEYVDTRTGNALLPKFEFVKDLLPQPALHTQWKNGFAATGTCLGHILSLIESGRGRGWSKWPDATLIKLNPDEVYYAHQLRKDAEGHYLTEGEYTYVPLTQEDLDEDITAGLNTFQVDDKYEEMLYRKPVFYYKQFDSNSKLHYPEILYRANYRGGYGFIDEPAVHFLWSSSDLEKIKRPEEGALLLSKRVQQLWTRPIPGERSPGLLRSQLQSLGVNLGTMALDDSDHPIWETISETAFYQLQSGAAGILHECRYKTNEFVNNCEWYLGPDVDASTKDMLLMDFAWMRGAARTFNKSWGVSIYGQCDPKVAPEALSLAYDMGARYMWFWTSDHQHHVPQYMKLKLMKQLKEYKAAHPRKSLHDLLYAPRTAIVVPYGYGWIISFYQMWESKNLNINTLNAAGITHRQLIAAIVAEGLACSRTGEDYDYVVDIGQSLKGYKRVIRIGLNGEVTDSADPIVKAHPVKLSASSVKITAPQAPKSFDSAKAIQIPYKANIKIDGDLSKWSDVKWVALDKQSQFGGWSKPEGGDYTWGGKDDLSGSFAFARDAKYLYIAARVRDDKLSQPGSGEMMLQGDSVQMGLDVMCDRARTGYAPDDIELGFALTPNGPQAYMWPIGYGRNNGLIPGAKVVVKRSDDGETTYEAAVPWESITSTPAQFINYMGMSLMINDNDGEGRKGYLVLTDGFARGKWPSAFEIAQLGSVPDSACKASVLLDDIHRAVNDRRKWQIRLDSWCREKFACKLDVVLKRRGSRVAEGQVNLQLPKGRSRCSVTFNASSILPGVYDCELIFRKGSAVLTKSVHPVYILK